MKKTYEVHLTESEYKRFKAFMLLISRFMDFYVENPDMEIVIKTKPKDNEWRILWVAVIVLTGIVLYFLFR